LDRKDRQRRVELLNEAEKAALLQDNFAFRFYLGSFAYLIANT